MTISLSLKAEADYLVARDNDLLTLGSYDKIQIVSPETFYQVLTDAANAQAE